MNKEQILYMILALTGIPVLIVVYLCLFRMAVYLILDIRELINNKKSK